MVLTRFVSRVSPHDAQVNRQMQGTRGESNPELRPVCMVASRLLSLVMEDVFSACLSFPLA